MFLSIIVPVYNVAPYLRECLHSLDEQDIPKTDYEIVCVDDGSTDSSLEILKDEASRIENLKVYTQKNAGVSSARNRGIDISAGDYLWFVDSDDFVRKNTLQELRSAAEDHFCDRVAFRYYQFSRALSDDERKKYNEGALSAGWSYLDASSVTSIIRRKLLTDHNIRFRDAAYAEDSVFIFETLRHVKKQISLGRTIYYYRTRPSSAMTSVSPETNEKKYLSYKTLSSVMKSYYDGSCGEIADIKRCADLYESLLQNMMYSVSQMSGKLRKKAIDDLREEKLFPYRRPRESTLKKSYMTLRTDFLGKLFDWIWLHQNTRLGFGLMVMYQSTRRLLRSKKQGRAHI